MILHGKHLIKVWTKQQSVAATSTADAELYAGKRAATKSMGVQAFAKDLGGAVPFRLHIDSSASQSTTSRTWLDKAKHIEIQHLWLRGGAQRETHIEEDPHRDELFGPGTKALDEREIRDVDGARELLLCMRLWISVQMANLVRTGRG